MTPPGLVSEIALSRSCACNLMRDDEVAGPLCPGDVGVAADGAGRAAGRVDERGVERRRLEGERVGDDDVGVEPEALEVLREHFQPLGRSVDSRHRRARPRRVRRSFRQARRRDRRRAGRTRAWMRRAGRRRRRPAPTTRPRRSPRVRRWSLWVSRRTEPVGSTIPPSLSAQASSVALDADVERRLASVRARRSPAPSIRRKFRAIAPRARQACRRRAGRRAERIASRSRATPRRTALTRPANGALAASARAARTARSTAAWSGASRKRICAAPAMSVHSSMPLRFGMPLSSFCASALRIVPRRRSATVAIERESAGSRGSRRALRRDRSAARRSSSGRACVTASMIARAAATRATIPGGVGSAGWDRPI